MVIVQTHAQTHVLTHCRLESSTKWSETLRQYKRRPRRQTSSVAPSIGPSLLQTCHPFSLSFVLECSCTTLEHSYPTVDPVWTTGAVITFTIGRLRHRDTVPRFVYEPGLLRLRLPSRSPPTSGRWRSVVLSLSRLVKVMDIRSFTDHKVQKEGFEGVFGEISSVFLCHFP